MFEKVWTIGYLLFIVVAIAIVINLYEEFNSIEDELERRKDENKNQDLVEDVPKEVNGIKKLNLTGENQLKLKTNKQEYNIRVVDKIIINKINEIIDKEY